MDTDFENADPLAETSALIAHRPASGEGQLTVDVYQDDGDIVIKSTIAGVTGGDLDISLSKDRVTIKGTRQRESQIKRDHYYHQELHWGSFSRSIILPEDVDTEKAKATLKNGLLTLRLPKLSKTQTKKIKITS